MLDIYYSFGYNTYISDSQERLAKGKKMTINNVPPTEKTEEEEAKVFPKSFFDEHTAPTQEEEEKFEKEILPLWDEEFEVTGEW
jgi:hypothetical protein